MSSRPIASSSYRLTVGNFGASNFERDVILDAQSKIAIRGFAVLPFTSTTYVWVEHGSVQQSEVRGQWGGFQTENTTADPFNACVWIDRRPSSGYTDFRRRIAWRDAGFADCSFPEFARFTRVDFHHLTHSTPSGFTYVRSASSLDPATPAAV